VSELLETGYVPGVVGRPSLISWVSGCTAGASVDAADDEELDEEQAASEAASNSAAATRTDGSALRRK
jgi:hypothetical protein